MADAKTRKPRRRAVKLAVVALALAVLALGMVYFPRTQDHAIALVTIDDCMRSFGEVPCHMIVDRAQAIHAETAPSYESTTTCELAYGAGHCTMLKRGLIQLNRYAPSMVAILITRNRNAIVPLYAAPEPRQGDAASKGQVVYFRGAPVGQLMQPKIGGADASYVADDKGEPLTADAVRALHGP